MIAYFIQVSCCWLIFHLIYRFFLRKETFFSINRMYLVGTLCLGLLLPLLRLLALELVATPDLVKVYIAPITTGMVMIEQAAQSAPTTNYYQLTDYVFGIYLIGVLVLVVKFLAGLYQIYRLYKTGVSEQVNSLHLVRTSQIHLPFSFWNTIFWSKEIELSATDFDKIVQHEEGHIRERHTVDVLLIEVLSILFWCSPPIWLYKISLKEIHEYLADAYVLTTTATKQYGHLLLRQVQPGLQVALANHFFQSQLKNRISMMTKTKSSNWNRWKYGIGMSALALLLMAFSMKMTTLQELIEQTGKTSFNWHTSELLGSDFDEQKVKTVLERKFKDENRAYVVDKEGNRIEPVGDNFHRSIQIAQLHQVYRDILHIYPDHQNEINEIATQLFADYGLNARIEKNTIIYTNENEVDEEESFFESNTKHIKQLQKGSDSMIFYDGERYEGSFADLDKKKMSYFAALTKIEALNKYGESGEDGAVEVFSKTEQELIEAEMQELSDEFRNDIHKISVDTIEENSLFTTTEVMPRFPGCEDKENKADREQCAQYELLQFVYENINYPKATKEAGLEGMVVVKFNIDIDGSVLDPKIVRSIDKYTDEEVLKMVRMMPNWIPGRQYGKVVKVQYNLPVKFKLEDNNQPQEKTTDKTNALEFNHLKMYPNPATDVLNVELETVSIGETILEITDSSGRIWKSTTLENINKITKTIFDINQLSSGMYFLTITQGNKKTSQSFVKE